MISWLRDASDVAEAKHRVLLSLVSVLLVSVDYWVRETSLLPNAAAACSVQSASLRCGNFFHSRTSSARTSFCRLCICSEKRNTQSCVAMMYNKKNRLAIYKSCPVVCYAAVSKFPALNLVGSAWRDVSKIGLCKNSGFHPGDREPFLEGSRADILCTLLHYICFVGVLDGGRWVIVGCYNGPRYKKG